MKTLIEKWKPMLEYKFKDGLSVSEYKYQECAEKLEKFETRYKDKPTILEDLLPYCVKEYSQGRGDKVGGSHLELLEELFTICQRIK